MGSLSPGRWRLPLCLAIGALLLLAAGGMALARNAGGKSRPISFRLSESRHVLAYGGQYATLSVHMHTGSSAETVAIMSEVSGWPDPGVIGSPLELRAERVSGRGRIGIRFVSSCCAVPAYACARGGPPPQGGGVDLSLPADSATILSYTVKLAAPPWPSLAMSIGVTASIPAVSSDPAAIRHYQVGAARFTASGPTGVRIILSAARGSPGLAPPESPFTVAQDHTLIIVSRTRPELRHQPIQLGYQRVDVGLRLGATTLRGRIGVAMTDGTGAFRIAWRPTRRGIYVIIAKYRHPRPGLLADQSCDLAVAVR